MPAPCSCDLKRRIVIQARTQTKDAQGGMVDSWATAYTVFAKIMHLSGNEKKVTLHGGQVPEARTEFTVRYNAGITAQHRISYGGKLFNIKHVNDYNEQHRFMILSCDTGLNDGR
jgi:SPP1 family predicted phage head-tail adaptor